MKRAKYYPKGGLGEGNTFPRLALLVQAILLGTAYVNFRVAKSEGGNWRGPTTGATVIFLQAARIRKILAPSSHRAIGNVPPPPVS